MRTPQIQSVIALALAASLACGCYKTTTATERVPGMPQRHLLAPKDRGQSLSGSFQFSNNAVAGTLAWNRTCQLEEQRPVQVQKVTTRKADAGGNFLLALASGAAVFGGLYTVTESSNGSCSGSSDCSSSREEAKLSGMMMIGGGLATLAAIGLSGRKQSEVGRETVDRSTQNSVVDSHAACGVDSDFDGLRLALVLPDGARLVGGVDLAGAVRIPVPSGIELPDHGVEGDIVVDDVPDHLVDRVRRGSRVGSVHLSRPASSKGASVPATTSRKRI